MFKSLRYILFLQLVLVAVLGYGQAPNISYSSPQTFTTGTPIAALKPSNTGGVVPATVYGQVSTFAGMSGVNGAVNGTGTAASFYFPTGVAIDASGNIYVADDFNNLIRKITPAGVVSTFAGTGLSLPFSNLTGVTVDPSGNIYGGDQGNALIRKITPGGLVSTFAGTAGVAGDTNGQGTNATFTSPVGLTADKNGNIYVVDPVNYLIRKITPAGLVSTYAGVAGVKGSTNGPVASATFNPLACAVDGNGNIYVADGGNHLIRLITPSGTVSTFAGSGAQGSTDGMGTMASFYQPNGITVDISGNIYVADGGNNIIRKITPGGLVSTLAGTLGVIGATNGIGTSASFSDIGGLATDLSGNLYEADVDSSLIRKISTTGYSIDKTLPPGLTFDATTGIITGTPTAFSTATNYTINAYNTSGNSTAIINIAVTGNLNFGPIPSMVYGAADFSPAVSNTGSVTYTSGTTSVADKVAGKIHILSVGTTTITATNGATTIQQLLTVTPATLSVIADNKSKAANAVNPPLTVTYGGFVYGESAANLTTQPSLSTPAITSSLPGSYPINISGAVDGNYTLNYIAGTLTILGGKTTIAAPAIKYTGLHAFTVGTAITPLSPANTGGAVPATVYGQVSTFAGTAGVQGSANGMGAAASFYQPYGVTLDVNGNVYATDQANNLIRKITPAGLVSTFAGSGVAGEINGTGTSASFNFPSGMTIDPTGNLYVADQAGGSVREISPQGSVSTFAANFSGPTGLAIDNIGNLYVGDFFNFILSKITPGGQVSIFAGKQGVQGSADGQGTAASFMNPAGVATDAMGNIYLADLYRIRMITPGGLVSTLAGSSTSGSNDGVGAAASFEFPAGLATDAANNVYVADETLIRKITPGGVVTTIAGTAYKNGSADGIGAAASFNGVKGLALDASGNLYMTDYTMIRKMVLTGYAIDKPLPAGLTFDATTGIISGTPTVTSPATNYTINAYNIGGGSTAIVTIEVAANNASLSTIALSPYSTLTNAGTTGTITTYTASVSYATTAVKVTPTTQDPTATVKVNGTAVASGTASASIPLAVGANTITTIVTAQDGTTTHTYSITVTRAAPSSNASLSVIALTPYSTLTNTGTVGTTTTYTATVSNATTSVKVTPTTSDANAKVKVNGVALTSGTASGSIALGAEGSTTTINTVVTAQDGTTTKTYSIVVTRAPSSNASLTTIALSPYSTLTNTGTTGTTTTYTTSVSNATTSVKVTPTTSDPNATVKVNGIAVTSGTASGSIALAVGQTTINTVVTAQDGITTKTYAITVTRATGPLHSLYLPISVVQPTDNLNIENDGVMVHQGVSPNGDGINDFLTIDGIIAYPDNSLQIIDRNGTPIYQAKGYNNITKVFDGHSGINGRMQQPGTYFYSLDYVADGQNRHKTGFILLKY